MSSLRSKMNIIIMIFVLFLFTCASERKVEAAGQGVELALHSENAEENVAFQLTNIFPGDSITQNYRLRISYTGTIAVCFQVAAEGVDENLSEVLEVKVQLADTEELLYEGTLEDMPVLSRELSTDSKSQTEELTYKITVGLSTSVGNEYQDKKLTVGFSWWAEGEQYTEPGEPEGGEDPTEPGKPEGGEGPTESDKPEDEEDTTESGEDGEKEAISTGGSLTKPPTGDDSPIFMWLAIICVSMAVMILVFTGYRRSRIKKTRSRLFLGIFLTVIPVLMLGITSSALIWQKVSVEENLFQTGIVSISLNDDQPVLKEDMLFEPGMVVKKDFTLRNDSTCDVHYRLYLANVDGNIAEAVKVQVLDGDTSIFEGTMADMNGKKSEGADGILREGEERVMTIVFHVPQDCGNVMQGGTIVFDLNADAVQTVNNPDGLFE